MEIENEGKSTRLHCTATVFVLALAGAAAGQGTQRVSVNSSGAEGNGESRTPSISADGRYVAFSSWASNLVGGDTNGVHDIFVNDAQNATTERVSVAMGGGEANGWSNRPSISASGRYVTFSSTASNLVAADTNNAVDIFVHDRQGDTTERVSVNSNGAQGNSGSFGSSISADGRYVAFDSVASNLAGGDTNGLPDVFVRDLQNGTTERVSMSSSGEQGNSSSFNPSISADGRYVAFDSAASNLASGDTNGVFDVFVHDRQSGLTERVSRNSGGTQGNGQSRAPSISANGRFVAFESDAWNLVTLDTNGERDVFIHDRQDGTTLIVSVDSDGMQGNGASGDPSISAEGRHVAFSSTANNLVSGDANFQVDTFVYDVQDASTECVSVDFGALPGNRDSIAPSISADSRYVAFESFATNLVGGDANETWDVFVRDRNYEFSLKYCTANANSTGSPADLTASGSASSSTGNLMLASFPVPNQNGVFFHGSQQSELPFGNGFLCTTGDIVRGAVVPGTGNAATYAYDNWDSQHSLTTFIGSTRNFQHWFRDPMGGGAHFNTSNAITMTILP